MGRRTAAVTRGEAAEAIFENGIVSLGADAVVRQAKRQGVFEDAGLAAVDQIRSRFANSILQRACLQLARAEAVSARQGVPVMVKAAPTESIRPRTPQFSSHSLSFMRYFPRSFRLPEDPAGPLLWEKIPSMTRV